MNACILYGFIIVCIFCIIGYEGVRIQALEN